MWSSWSEAPLKHRVRVGTCLLKSRLFKEGVAVRAEGKRKMWKWSWDCRMWRLYGWKGINGNLTVKITPWKGFIEGRHQRFDVWICRKPAFLVFITVRSDVLHIVMYNFHFNFHDHGQDPLSFLFLESIHWCLGLLVAALSPLEEVDFVNKWVMTL